MMFLAQLNEQSQLISALVADNQMFDDRLRSFAGGLRALKTDRLPPTLPSGLLPPKAELYRPEYQIFYTLDLSAKDARQNPSGHSG